MNEKDRTRAKILGVLIRDARLHKGRTVIGCAAAIGVDPADFEAFEMGEKAISLPELEALAMFLQVPLAHFWGTKTLGNYPQTQFVSFVGQRQKKIGTRIGIVREEQGHSVNSLAEATGLSADFLAAVEAGEAYLSLFELETVTSVLGHSFHSLMGGDDPVLEKHEAQAKQQRRFEELSAEMQAFVTEPINHSYLEIAMRLSKMNVNDLRTVAENILNITF